MMYFLYYLIDQTGDITGAKVLVSSFPDIVSANAQASADSVLHYSIEQPTSNGASIIYIQ